jgi:hypothetical protein
MGQRDKKTGYHACMNQNDTITALCSVEARVRTEPIQAQGLRMLTPPCPGGAGP